MIYPANKGYTREFSGHWSCSCKERDNFIPKKVCLGSKPENDIEVALLTETG